ncbi:AMP-binding protein [Erwinia mallotivora]|uniref:AMP-dependent synthetase/ligase domain-containing protein n=1 Tax=Erwinia mallotivora TaxID=69222 RepID=A0A014PZB1_9GAMM|nr:AMP-binding protein [Erwinia mallotivora]EXU76307.1 hypothetical protein BG55_06415 [Erwinia mallotivora]
MNKQALNKLVDNARKNTIFYQQLYKHAPAVIFDLKELPIATHEKIMSVAHDPHRVSEIFSVHDAFGMFSYSSSTTGKPKTALFGRDDWRKTNEILAMKHTANQVICAGDVVCNLSEPGSASFMAVHDIINLSSAPCSEIPLGCDHSYERIVEACQQFKANVISGINSTALGIACYLYKNNQTMPQIRKIWGGGELLYGAQQELLKRSFPQATLIPFMYGTTEAGAIGFSKPGYQQNVYNTIDESVVIENIDIKTGEEIVECGVMGVAVVTNKLRTSAPAIRLDTGDFMQWIDPPGTPVRLFSIHGRRYPRHWTFKDIRFTETDVSALLKEFEKELEITKFQIQLHAGEINLILSLLDESLSAEDIKDRASQILRNSENPVAHCLTDNNYSLHRVGIDYLINSSKRKSKLIVEGELVC